MKKRRVLLIFILCFLSANLKAVDQSGLNTLAVNLRTDDSGGIVIINDGSKNKLYSQVYEFSQMGNYQLSNTGTYKVTLTNGQIKSGLAGHVSAMIAYPSMTGDLTSVEDATQYYHAKLTQMEKIFASYEYSRPFLAQRIIISREMLAKAQSGNVRIQGTWISESTYKSILDKELKKEIAEITISGRNMQRVKIKGVTSDEVVLASEGGTSRVKLIELNYSNFKQIAQVSALFKDHAAVRKLYEEYHSELVLGDEKYLGARVVSLNENSLLLSTEKGPVSLEFNNLSKDKLDLLSSKSSLIKDHLIAQERATAETDVFYRNALASEATGNLSQAYELYRRASTLGHNRAEVNYAILLTTGKGGPKDTAQALEIFKKAAKRGDAIAAFNAGFLLSKEKNSTAKIQSGSSGELATALKKAQSQKSTFALATTTNDSEFPDQAPECFFYLEQAAQQNIPQAQYLLGVLHANGFGSPVNYSQSLKYLNQAVDSGFVDATPSLKAVTDYLKTLETSPDNKTSLQISSDAYLQKATQAAFVISDQTSGSHQLEDRATQILSFLDQTTSQPSYSTGKNLDLAIQSTVLIKTSTGYGSGFFIAPGVILSNAHVVGSASSVNVRINDELVVPGKVLAVGENLDVAVIQIEGRDHPILNIGSSNEVRVGDNTTAIGFPIVQKISATTTFGRISSIDRIFLGNPCFQVDISINPGNSGGPLLNNDGNVIGINTFGLGAESNIDRFNFAIKMDEVTAFIKENLPDIYFAISKQ